MPDKIKVRGAQVHNLKDADADVPLNQVKALQRRLNPCWLCAMLSADQFDKSGFISIHFSNYSPISL